MLGRLLHLGSSGPSASQPVGPNNTSTSRPILSLESVQEDIHTRNLLFPDAHALYQHRNDQVFPLSTAPTTPGLSTANTYDYSEDVELDVKDVRILVMQDALGPANASLLFDSHQPSEFVSSERSPARQDPRRVPVGTRKGSLTQTSRPLAIQPESPQPRQGAFDRRASIHGRGQSYAETEAQRAAREYREELATFSSCIFGNSELMAYKGTSTKVHVVPTDVRANDSASSSIYGDGRSSIGRSSGRSSKLSQSYSSQTVSPSPLTGAVQSFGGNPSRSSDKRKVLITRLFPVNLPAEDVEPGATPQFPFSEENSAFPFPVPGDESAQKKNKSQPKQRRTPMYAVVLVVQIPRTSSRTASAAPSKSLFREPGSYNDQDLFSSSYNSTKAAGPLSGLGGYGEALDAAEFEDRIDSLTRHWDIIMRTLTNLQSLIATTLHAMLKQADIASPGPYSMSSGTNLISRTPSMSDRRGNEFSRAKPSKSTTKLVLLCPNCLADDVNVASEVGLARSRIVMGLSAARVITGQGRWGIWRDEAIWMFRWAASLERTAFFHNALTGFLATHTDWIQAVCGPSYRKRAALAHRNRNEEDMSLPARTIIISDDKMAARRLIFLLSAFLPANQQIPTARAHRPSTSASVGGYSNSPPTYIIPVLREESLRRKINRRTGLRRTSHSKSISQSVRNSTMMSQQFAQMGLDHTHQRRASDAASIRTANLPMPGQDILSRKSSAATTTAVMPETTTPHFASVQPRDNPRRTRPGSSGSLAADDLKRSLKRGDSNGQVGGVSRPPSSGLKWGNLMSGLWSTRRRDSVDNCTYSPGAADMRSSPNKAGMSRIDKLSEVVRETEDEEIDPCAPNTSPGPDAREFGSAQDSQGRARGRGSFAQPDRTPDPTGAFESPVKTSINEDGVIDVDVPFPDYIASFESAISSPSSSGYLSIPGGLPHGLESLEQQARFAIEGDLPLNAAGWLNRFHPDFALQAVPPQDDLKDKIKAALRAEPTPAPTTAQSNTPSERWVDVSSVMIADTTKNSITRIVYRRLVRSKASFDRYGVGDNENTSGNGFMLTPSILPYEAQLEEEWIEDTILTCDQSLKEAVERVIHNGDLSRDSSTESSQTSSDLQGSMESDSTMPDTLSEVTQLANRPLETPRVQCKTVMLAALEDMFRDAVETHYGDHVGQDDNRNNRHRHSILRDAVRDWVARMEAVE